MTRENDSLTVDNRVFADSPECKDKVSTGIESSLVVLLILSRRILGTVTNI